MRNMRNKRAKFVELVNNRVNRTIKDLWRIGNLRSCSRCNGRLKPFGFCFGRSGEKPNSEFS